METKLYQINSMFARANKIPVYFAASKLRETAKAVFLYGHGTLETKNFKICCVCGRELTHPVSKLLGIGPECGKHYWDWDRVGGYSEENVQRVKQMVDEKIKTEMAVNQWMPKSVLKEVYDTETIISVPPDHPILQQEIDMKKVTKKVEMITFQATGEKGLKITFPYNVEDLNNVKTLFGRRFHNEGFAKYWSAELRIDTLKSLLSWGFLPDKECQDFMIEELVQYNEIQPIPVNGLGGTLRPFQEKGVAFIKAKGGRALIADEMGLGKTVQALAYIQEAQKWPVIIVCPASLKLNWKRETEKWIPNSFIQVLSGKKISRIVGDIIIINYDILNEWTEVLQATKPQIIVTDEAHYYKSRTAKRTKAVKTLAKGVPHFIALTGTPIVNRPIEIFNALKIIKGSLFPNFMHFAQRYCGAKHNGYGWDFNGASNAQELHKILTSTIMIRRLKSEVLKELPAKTRSYIPMELDNWKDYKNAESDFINWVRFTKGNQAALQASQAETLVRIEALKQLAVAGKMIEAVEWINDFLESGQKLVLFAVHKTVIDALMQSFSGKAVKIDGSVSQENRQLAVDQFQNNPSIQLFIGNIKAAGVGLTLTAASNVAFLELPWTPGDLTQAEDRCHRMGQKDAVNIHYLLAEGTIEEKIANLIDSKMKVLDAVLDGKETDSSSLLTELLNNYQDGNI